MSDHIKAPAVIETEADAVVKSDKAAIWKRNFERACEAVAWRTAEALKVASRPAATALEVKRANELLKLARLVRKEAFNQWKCAKADV